jgi:hypothetical protein
MDGRGVEIDLLPAKVDQLANSQGMPERHQDQQPIADRVAPAVANRLSISPSVRYSRCQ